MVPWESWINHFVLVILLKRDNGLGTWLFPLKKKWYLLCLEHFDAFLCSAAWGPKMVTGLLIWSENCWLGELFPELLNPSKSLKSVNHWFYFWFLLLPPLLLAGKFWLNCHFKTTAIGCWLKKMMVVAVGKAIQILVCQWYANSRLAKSKQLRLGRHSIQTSRFGTLGRFDLYIHMSLKLNMR